MRKDLEGDTRRIFDSTTLYSPLETVIRSRFELFNSRIQVVVDLPLSLSYIPYTNSTD